MSAPSIGALRDEIVLEEQIRTPTTGGGAVLAWSPLATLWSQVRPLTGREAERAGRIVSEVSHEVWIRQRAGTTAAMRFRRQARVLDILAVLPVGARGQWMRCLCRERDAQ